jgi:hypothetical protein
LPFPQRSDECPDRGFSREKGERKMTTLTIDTDNNIKFAFDPPAPHFIKGGGFSSA